MASTPSVIVPAKYSFYNLLYWIQYLSFAFWWLVPMLLTFVTFSFKSWFFFAFIFSMTMLITIVAFSIEFFFPIAPTFIWNMTYLSTVTTSRFLVPLSSLLGWLSFFCISNSYFSFLSVMTFLIQLIHVYLGFHHSFIGLFFSV